jgi:hypothetical protein
MHYTNFHRQKQALKLYYLLVIMHLALFCLINEMDIFVEDQHKIRWNYQLSFLLY